MANLSNLILPPDRSIRSSVSAKVWAPAAASIPAAEPRAQKSVSGYSMMRGFEGGQMPLHRRLPKRGFTNIFKKEYAIINLNRLNELDGDTFDPGKLLELGIIKKLHEGLKVLGTGELTRAITVKAHLFSKSALDKIQKSGGTAEVISRRIRHRRHVIMMSREAN